MNEKYFPNPLRSKLLAGKPLIGCWAALGSPITTEVLGLAGFDWLLLDCEHAPNDVMTTVPQLMALKDSVSMPIVRPPYNEQVVLKRLLDIGFYNFLIPMVQTAEEARNAVSFTRYPPEGIRGVSVAQRSNAYGTVPDYFSIINKNITIIAQIETQLSIDNVDEIAAVDGIDCLFIGPGDLSAAMGHIGHPEHPDVQKAIKYVFDRAKAHHKASGILAPKEADAHRYMEWGATFVGVGSDLGAFRSATQALCDKFKK